MTDRNETLDCLIEAARLLGITQAKKGYGVYTIDDGKVEGALHKSIDKYKAALAQPEHPLDKKAENARELGLDYEPVAKYDLIELHVLHSHFAGLLYDFMGWLTSRRIRLCLSDRDNASPAVDAIVDFAKMRGLNLQDAQVEHWQSILTTPHSANGSADSAEGFGKPEQKSYLYEYAKNLAVFIWTKHYKKESPDWKPLLDVLGVLTQIDNMTCGLEKAQPEQRAAWQGNGGAGYNVGGTGVAKPEQEPVAWMASDNKDIVYASELDGNPESRFNTPLYTAPPKREWVGLTGEEIKKIMQRWRGEFDIRDIERLLKEKNT